MLESTPDPATATVVKSTPSLRLRERCGDTRLLNCKAFSVLYHTLLVHTFIAHIVFFKSTVELCSRVCGSVSSVLVLVLVPVVLLLLVVVVMPVLVVVLVLVVVPIVVHCGTDSGT